MNVAEQPEVTFDLSPAAMCDLEQIYAEHVEATSFSELDME